MKLDLLGGSYQQKYIEFNPQRTINWYQVLSTQAEKTQSQTALFPFPGLSLYSSIVGRYNRGIFVARTNFFTRCFTVVDNTLWEINSNQTSTNLGTLTNISIGSTRVYMCVNANNEVGIFHSTGAYSFQMSTNTLTEITSNQFCKNVIYADFLDGDTIVVSPTNQFTTTAPVYFSTGNDMLTGWNSTNVFGSTFKPSQIKAAIAFREEIYILTDTTIEIYYNDGSTPWTRLPRSTILIGACSAESIAISNDGFYFVGRTQSGETNVFFFDSYYNCVPIADSSIAWAGNSNNLEVLQDSKGFIQYSKDGHCFYHLEIPELKTTFVYDTFTKLWQERQSLNPSADSDGITRSGTFRGRYYANFNSMNLFTDKFSGDILIEDFTTRTENGTPIIRTRISQTFSEEYMNISAASLELDCNTGCGISTGQGSNPVMMIELSRDGGYNYGQPRNLLLGAVGNHLFRARLRKLGSSRKWTVKMVQSDPVDLEINNAIVHGTVGIS